MRKFVKYSLIILIVSMICSCFFACNGNGDPSGSPSVELSELELTCSDVAVEVGTEWEEIASRFTCKKIYNTGEELPYNDFTLVCEPQYDKNLRGQQYRVTTNYGSVSSNVVILTSSGYKGIKVQLSEDVFYVGTPFENVLDMLTVSTVAADGTLAPLEEEYDLFVEPDFDSFTEGDYSLYVTYDGYVSNVTTFSINNVEIVGIEVSCDLQDILPGYSFFDIVDNLHTKYLYVDGGEVEIVEVEYSCDDYDPLVGGQYEIVATAGGFTDSVILNVSTECSVVGIDCDDKDLEVVIGTDYGEIIDLMGKTYFVRSDGSKIETDLLFVDPGEYNCDDAGGEYQFKLTYDGLPDCDVNVSIDENYTGLSVLKETLTVPYSTYDLNTVISSVGLALVNDKTQSSTSVTPSNSKGVTFDFGELDLDVENDTEFEVVATYKNKSVTFTIVVSGHLEVIVDQSKNSFEFGATDNTIKKILTVKYVQNGEETEIKSSKYSISNMNIYKGKAGKGFTTDVTVTYNNVSQKISVNIKDFEGANAYKVSTTDTDIVTEDLTLELLKDEELLDEYDYGKYYYIIKDIPSVVYNTNALTNVQNGYDHAKEFATMYCKQIGRFAGYLNGCYEKKYSAKLGKAQIAFTFYPSLVKKGTENGINYTARVKVTVLSVSDGVEIRFDDYFGSEVNAGTDGFKEASGTQGFTTELVTGITKSDLFEKDMEFWVDISGNLIDIIL